MTDTAGPVQVTQDGPVTIPRELFDFLMGVGEIDGTSFGDLNAGLPGRFWWRALLRTAEARAASNWEGAGVDLAAQLERLGDDYADGKAFHSEQMGAAVIAASCFYQAAELVKRDVASSNFCALVEGLHAQIFGVHSLADPALSHAALADGGQIHETAHALIRSLPASLNPSQDGEASS